MSSQTILVDNLPTLHTCLDDISPSPAPLQEISLAIDVEGVDLCRHGRVSIVQIKSKSSRKVWLIDVTVLGRQAFYHTDPAGRSLKRIFENASIKKIFYDVRNDADALFQLYDVDMKNVYDIQLLELAVRHSLMKGTIYLSGLSKSIENYIIPPRGWKATKDTGLDLFCPERGGSYSVFERRPMDPRILSYCSQDVTLLHNLEAALMGRFGPWGHDWQKRVVAASASRVAQARSRFYEGGGRRRALAPEI